MPSEKELAIAGFYDGIFLFYGKANTFLTFGLDLYWRRSAARAALKAAPGARRALDVCCGTGDFMLELRRAFGPSLELAGADLSEAMLSLARERLPGAEFSRCGASELPFPDNSFDLVTISFATRNINTDGPALRAALAEFRRVLKPGGVFLNLETTRPANPLLWTLMKIYVRAVIGALALVSPKSRGSYAFLKNTILGFFTAGELALVLAEAGFTDVGYGALFPGAAAVHTARKPAF